MIEVYVRWEMYGVIKLIDITPEIVPLFLGKTTLTSFADRVLTVSIGTPSVMLSYLP
jgi:hypothetical protein